MIRVAVAVALPGRQEVFEVEIAEGGTVADALAAARLPERFPGVDLAGLRVGIWSRAVEGTAVVREGDRIELYRALKADPKDARRSRARLKPSTRSRSGP